MPKSTVRPLATIKKCNGVSSYDILAIQMLAGHSWRICTLEDFKGSIPRHVEHV
jgi:hypothetical protein